MGSGPHWFYPFTWFFGWIFVVFLAMLVFRFFGFRRHAWGCGGYGGYGGPFDAEAILKRRLAGGEIGEADYQRLKELLGK